MNQTRVILLLWGWHVLHHGGAGLQVNLLDHLRCRSAITRRIFFSSIFSRTRWLGSKRYRRAAAAGSAARLIPVLRARVRAGG